MTPQELEAESRKYGNDIVMLLKLSDGSFAVFNAARVLQFFSDPHTSTTSVLSAVYDNVERPEIRLPKAITLEELGL